MTITPGVILFSNDANTNLAGAITNTATSATLTSGSGAEFPSPGAGQYFVGTFIDAATGNLTEVVHVTAISGDVITMVRAQEGTTALNWSAGDIFFNGPTGGTLASMAQQTQVQTAIMSYAVDSGSVNALAITLAPVPVSLASLIGAPIRVKVGHANTSTTPTLTVNGFTATTIVNPPNAALSNGQMPANAIMEFVYDGTNFQLQTGISSGGGVSSINVIDASNGGLAFTGGPVTGSGSITAKLLPSDLLTKASPVPGDSFLLMDSAASSAAKTALLSTLGNVGRFVSSQQTITLSSRLTLAHGLGATPTQFDAYLVNQIAELGYGVGAAVHMQLDITYPGPGFSNSGGTVSADSTNVYLSLSGQGIYIAALQSGASAGGYITTANWKVYLVARL